jgi:hypothetical protein
VKAKRIASVAVGTIVIVWPPSEDPLDPETRSQLWQRLSEFLYSLTSVCLKLLESLLVDIPANFLDGFWPIDKRAKPIIFVVDNAGWSIRYSLLSTPLVPALQMSSSDLL